MPLWTPEKEWDGQDVIIIGGGASLRGFDFKRLTGRNTIGCNDAFMLGPEICHTTFFGDSGYWNRRKWDLEKFKGRVATCSPVLFKLKLDWLWQLDRVPDGLHSGHTVGWNESTGAAAVNLALMLGSKRIFLLGFDMTRKGSASHWHDYYAKVTIEEVFFRHLKGFRRIASCLQKRFPDVTVYNVTDGTSKLNFFPQVRPEDLEKVLQ